MRGVAAAILGAPPTCACVADATRGDDCDVNVEGELVLSCP